jgi:hypothetical protein
MAASGGAATEATIAEKGAAKITTATAATTAAASGFGCCA